MVLQPKVAFFVLEKHVRQLSATDGTYGFKIQDFSGQIYQFEVQVDGLFVEWSFSVWF